jgi:hypothetical protein
MCALEFQAIINACHLLVSMSIISTREVRSVESLFSVCTQVQAVKELGWIYVSYLGLTQAAPAHRLLWIVLTIISSPSLLAAKHPTPQTHHVHIKTACRTQALSVWDGGDALARPPCMQVRVRGSVRPCDGVGPGAGQRVPSDTVLLLAVTALFFVPASATHRSAPPSSRDEPQRRTLPYRSAARVVRA